MARECIIKVTGKGLFLNKHLNIVPAATNLPYENLNIEQDVEVYWLVEQINYEKARNKLIVEVKDYFYLPTLLDFNQQIPKLPVDQIFFKNLRDIQVLKQAIQYYRRFVNTRLNNYNPEEQADIFAFAEPEIKSDKINREINLDFKMHFKDAFFRNGFIVFEKYIPELERSLLFEIENSHVLAEYEFIKSYFGKIFKNKKFRVFATINTAQEEVHISCESPELAKIDQEMIDNIKQLRTRELIKSHAIADPDKSLFTADDVFDTLSDEEEKYGNVFKQTEEDILLFLMNFKSVRNRKQLEFLAGKLQSDKMKLKFTMHPHFGFLFLLEGDTMNHFCWELLNSHATYLWSIDKATRLPLQIKRIERIINSIRTMGRQQYRMHYLHNALDDDFVFSVINHDSISSDFVDGFSLWKHKLMEKII